MIHPVNNPNDGGIRRNELGLEGNGSFSGRDVNHGVPSSRVYRIERYNLATHLFSAEGERLHKKHPFPFERLRFTSGPHVAYNAS
jgi:hypothetical protein